MDQIEVFAPATIANVVCGFDVLGFALQAPGDKMVLRKTDGKGVRIVHHDQYSLPVDPHRNVAGITLLALLETVNADFGLELEITKGLRPGGGLGSSAASSAGAAVAANHLLGNMFTPGALIGIAVTGESFASKARHADNIAPAILGGFTLVRSVDPVEVVSLNFPPLFVTVIYPHIEVKTSVARAMLKPDVPIESVIRQTANLGALVAGLNKGDYKLISRSLKDYIVEPVRSVLIPHYEELLGISKDAGALGGGIAGSGPSVFMFSENEEIARNICVAMSSVYEKTVLEYDTYISPISSMGVRVIEEQTDLEAQICRVRN